MLNLEKNLSQGFEVIGIFCKNVVLNIRQYLNSLRTADAFPVVASLFFGGREATTGNASAVRRLISQTFDHPLLRMPKIIEIKNKTNAHINRFRPP